MNYLTERRQEEKDRRRSDILDSAEFIAAAVGIDELTMEQVARHARLSRALIYVYFKDRTDLHMGLCDRALGMLLERFDRAAAEHARGLDKITAIGRAYVAFTQEFPVYFDALSRFEAQGSPAADAANVEDNAKACLESGLRVHGAMIAAIKAGIADGSIRKNAGDPRLIALTLWGFVHGILQVAMTKQLMLDAHGVATATLIEAALGLAAQSIAAAERTAWPSPVSAHEQQPGQ